MIDELLEQEYEILNKFEPEYDLPTEQVDSILFTKVYDHLGPYGDSPGYSDEQIPYGRQPGLEFSEVHIHKRLRYFSGNHVGDPLFRYAFTEDWKIIKRWESGLEKAFRFDLGGRLAFHHFSIEEPYFLICRNGGIFGGRRNENVLSEILPSLVDICGEFWFGFKEEQDGVVWGD